MNTGLMLGGGTSGEVTILGYVLEECFKRLEDEDGDEDVIGDPDRSQDMGLHPPHIEGRLPEELVKAYGQACANHALAGLACGDKEEYAAQVKALGGKIVVCLKASNK